MSTFVARQARDAVRPHLSRLYDLPVTDRMPDRKAA